MATKFLGKIGYNSAVTRDISRSLHVAGGYQSRAIE